MSHPMNTPMHRFKYTKLTKSQIGEKLKASAESGPVCCSEYTGELSGRYIRIITDNGPVFDYSFRDKKNLSVKVDGNPFTGSYGALALKNMVFFSHMIPSEQRGFNVFIDQDTSLVTIIEVWFSSGRKERTMGGNEIILDDREVQRQIYYGYVEKNGQAAPETRHHLTNRIEGRGMYWMQDTGIETLEFYSSVISTNFTHTNMDVNNMPFSDILAGKEFTLRYDRGGPVIHYQVEGKFKLKYWEDKESTWHEVEYRAYEADDDLAWFSHLLVDSKPRTSLQIALDLTNGLTTCIHSRMGTEYYGNEVSYYAIFGVADLEGIKPPRYLRHELSDDLVGHAWSWTYSNNMTSMHLFTAPNSHSWTIYTADQSLGAQWCAPSLLVKVRNGVHILAECEEACNGHEMIVMINEKIKHDCGFGFSGGKEGIRLNPIGAIGRHIGYYDIKKYFGPKARKKGV